MLRNLQPNAIPYKSVPRGTDTVTTSSMESGFRQCIERKFPSIKVYYREEESGCDVFYTNDADRIYFPERYFLDNYDEPLYYKTIEEAAESVSEIVGHDVAPTVEAIEESLNNYEEEHEDEAVFYSFHEFLITDP